MVTLQHIAKIAQLSHMQEQMIALAIELGVDKDEFVQEVALGWDKQLEAYNVVLATVQAVNKILTAPTPTDGDKGNSDGN